MYTEEQLGVWMDRIAKRSDNGLLQIFVTDHNPYKHVENIVSRVSSRLDRVLDVGCGTGEFMFQLKELFPTASVSGVNLFASQVALEPRDWGVPYILDFTKPVTPQMVDGPYSTVFCNYTLGHAGNLSQFLKNAYDVLGPSGTFACWDVAPRTVMAKDFLGYRLRSAASMLKSLNQAGFVDVTREFPEVPGEAYLSKNFLGVADPEIVDRVMWDLRPVLYVARKI